MEAEFLGEPDAVCVARDAAVGKNGGELALTFDGLFALARNELQLDPTSGRLFVFVNRRGSQMKVLYFDRSGFCIWAKRLERGRFIGNWQEVSSREMDWTALKLLLEGIEPRRVSRRFSLQKSA